MTTIPDVHLVMACDSNRFPSQAEWLLKYGEMFEGHTLFTSARDWSALEGKLDTNPLFDIIPYDIYGYLGWNRWALHHLPLHADKFKGTHVLVAQDDTAIVNPSAWGDWMREFDYIGAPWSSGEVGNGGFSLRSKKLLSCLHRLSWEIEHTPRHRPHEDAIIGWDFRKQLELMGCRFPDAATAARFSTEAWPAREYEYNGSFGVHGKVAMEHCRAKGLIK